jgi:hypothetical protein
MQADWHCQIMIEQQSALTENMVLTIGTAGGKFRKVTAYTLHFPF